MAKSPQELRQVGNKSTHKTQSVPVAGTTLALPYVAPETPETTETAPITLGNLEDLRPIAEASALAEAEAQIRALEDHRLQVYNETLEKRLGSLIWLQKYRR
ncbi:MAG: hypothetical protein AAF766_18495 [Cyanobacteria bacterium P01_D01_bin.14]